MITVDAYSGRVYEGKVDKLLEMRIEKKWFMKDTPVYNLLRKRADLILPLNLIDPKSPQFIPDNCKTIHDIMRYIHEKSYGEVFQISDMASDRGSMSVRLKAPASAGSVRHRSGQWHDRGCISVINRYRGSNHFGSL